MSAVDTIVHSQSPPPIRFKTIADLTILSRGSLRSKSMCGIIGYVGKKPAVEILKDALTQAGIPRL